METATELVRRMGKTPVAAKDTPGFIVNRIARPFYNEALRILSDGGATVETIDKVMKGAGGFPMGPFELMDLIGIDINFAATQSLFEAFFHDPRFRPSPIQQRMFLAGNLGRKTGRGFYTYGDK
jgi:3-hydroxybutyryl-CoA dehydrogenase